MSWEGMPCLVRFKDKTKKGVVFLNNKQITFIRLYDGKCILGSECDSWTPIEKMYKVISGKIIEAECVKMKDVFLHLKLNGQEIEVDPDAWHETQELAWKGYITKLNHNLACAQNLAAKHEKALKDANKNIKKINKKLEEANASRRTP